MNRSERILIYPSEGTVRRLRMLAMAEDVTMQELLRRLIEKYLSENEARLAILETALENARRFEKRSRKIARMPF